MSDDNTNDDEQQIDSIPKFREMILRGTEYRTEYDFEMFGEAVTIELQPLADKVYMTILDELEENVDDEKLSKMLQEAKDIESEEEAKEQFDTGFVAAMRSAAKLGIDPDSVGETREGVMELVDKMVGGESIKIGREVMDITSNVSKAKQFPGGRARE